MIKETLVLATLAIATAPASAEPIANADIYVIDGDTVTIHGKPPNVRLVGFNAPETWKPACEAERQLGDKATRRLRELVHGGKLDLEMVVCSCPAGTQGTPACNYGRTCGTLRSNGRDVGAILIEEGLAVPFVCGTTRCLRPQDRGANTETADAIEAQTAATAEAGAVTAGGAATGSLTALRSIFLRLPVRHAGPTTKNPQ
jgi:endonuclease YncB( thermonuclease family)